MKHKETVYYLASTFILCTIASIILTLTKLSFLESIRISFGSVFVLFLPGYIITELFNKIIDIIEKIALSFALSIAIVPLTVFYLNKLGMRINTLNSILTISGIIIISVIIYKIRAIFKYP